MSLSNSHLVGSHLVEGDHDLAEVIEQIEVEMAAVSHELPHHLLYPILGSVGTGLHWHRMLVQLSLQIAEDHTGLTCEGVA